MAFPSFWPKAQRTQNRLGQLAHAPKTGKRLTAGSVFGGATAASGSAPRRINNPLRIFSP